MRAEWGAVCCLEAYYPSFKDRISAEKMTAGDIANELIALANSINDKSLKRPYRRAAVAFKNSVPDRNRLLHANPITSNDNEQILMAGNRYWTIDEVTKAADKFAKVDIELNELFCDRLIATRKSS